MAGALACAPVASAKTYRCPDISAEAYGDVVVSNINPVSSLGVKSIPSSGACFVAIDVVAEAMLKIGLDHVANPSKPYPTTLKLRIEPDGVNAIEIWRYKIRYVKASILHGYAVATCAGQKITWTIGPHPPKVIGS
jgi:hypothetical protein